MPEAKGEEQGHPPGSLAAFESSARSGTVNCPLLTGDGAVDERSVREDVEEACLRSDGNPREPTVPLAKQDLQLVAQLDEIAEAVLQFGEPFSHQRADAPTRGAATLTLRQGRRQIVKREANRQRPPHQSYASDRFGWIEAIPALAASRNAEHTLALVVPQRIGADARQPREFRRAEHPVPFGVPRRDVRAPFEAIRLPWC